MATFKRSKTGPWWYKFTVRGELVCRSARTHDREAANELEAIVKARYWRRNELGESAHTWGEAVERYQREASWRASTRKRNLYALRFFERLTDIPLAEIKANEVRAAADYVYRFQRPASGNRILAVFRSVLRACVGWGWLEHCPPVSMAHVADKEPQWLTKEQCQALLREVPEHTRAPLIFSILTGLRMANVRDLTWDRVDLERGHLWVPSSHYKTKKTLGLSLSAAAVRLLSALPRECQHVFTYKGERVKDRWNTRAFRNARKRAGVADIRWHDLRHTFASWLAIEGASELVLMQLGGWTSTKMPARYAHLRASDTRQWVDAVGAKIGTALEMEQKDDANPLNLVPGRGLEPPTRALRMRAAIRRVK